MKTKLLFLLLLASLSSFSQQYTAIPDINFEKDLINKGIDSGVTDGKVLTSKINTITDLTLNFSYPTSDLTGIEGFVALKKLFCFALPLTSLDLSKNLALSQLNCNGDLLTSLNISKNIALTILECNGNSLATLDVSSNINLETLSCDYNLLTNLDVSKNTALTQLACGNNKLISLDITQNLRLFTLAYHSNQLVSLDISKHVNLVYLFCQNNLLTSLDISKNPMIKNLICDNNQLTNLNLKNGGNTLFDTNTANFHPCSFKNNPNLTCILVDDATYSNTNWSNIKDATATYTTDCATLNTENHIFEKIAIYPNPTKGELHLDNIVLEKAMVYDALGKLIKTTKFTSSLNNNTVSLAGVSKGVYYVYLHSAGATTAKKIVVE
jgi:Secretion system C-terminal sorting domain